MRSVSGLIVLAFGQSLAAAAVPAADMLWQNGDYRGAFAQAIEPAIRGDPHAQFLIGEAYRLGRSVDANFPQAEDWYARAARQGDVGAATELGLLLASQHLDAAALPWLTLAAQHGEPRALCSLAALYYNGDGVPRDEPLAYGLMLRAAQAGLPEAKARLATLRTLLSPEAQARGEALTISAIPNVAPPPIALAAHASSAPPSSRAPLPTVGAMQRVQVGAYRSAAAAEQAWTLLRGHVAGLDKTDHAVVQAGAIYRLQARLPDREAAEDFCRRLKEAGWDHFTRQGTVRA
jgi:TPR repeat protein